MSASTWDELYAILPEELRRYQLREAWSHELLWELDLPVEGMPVSELAWQLELPSWRDGERFFAVRPLDVLADPQRHPEQHERTCAADLGYPLDITLRHGRWFILDGVHRLLKAVMLGIAVVQVRKLPADQLTRIAA